MNEKRLSLLKLAINVKYITLIRQIQIFSLIQISWLFIICTYIKKRTIFHAPLCQSVNLYIHPSANCQ